MDMKRLGFLFGLGLCAAAGLAQTLPTKWEELTGPDFLKAVRQAGGVCLLPMGSLEKAGPAGPLGTNLYVARIMALEAAKQEYAVVFPEYFVAGTNDVANLAGAVAYSDRLQLDMLTETVGEMARNGCKKVVLVNGHSGNNGLMSFFINSNMTKPKDYVVYALQGGPMKVTPQMAASTRVPPALMPSKPNADGHGGEERMAILMAYHRDVVHPERGHDETVVPEGTLHLNLPGGNQGVSIGIARAKEAPTGYLGDASGATAERGKALVENTVARLVVAIKAIKADNESAPLQKQFWEQWGNPTK